jgi:hypothetical protein
MDYMKLVDTCNSTWHAQYIIKGSKIALTEDYDLGKNALGGTC